MLKTLIISAIVLVILFSFIGCGGAKPSEPADTEAVAKPTPTVQLTPTPTITTEPSPSPSPTPTPTMTPTVSQGKIVFVSDRDGNNEIYLMDADGSDQTRLTNSSANETCPVWSPDGSKIAFLSDKDWDSEAEYDPYSNPNNIPECDIHVMNADGSNQLNITDNDMFDLSPDWSPDGKRIAFISNRYGQIYFPIFAINADGSHEEFLTKEEILSVPPFSWSPDGGKIAFSCSDWEDDIGWQIYLVNADGSTNMTILTDNETESYYRKRFCPVWSPDGNMIAFFSGTEIEFEGNDQSVTVFSNGNVYIMNADGSDNRLITNYPANDARLKDILWSPDGTKIAYEYWYSEGDDENPEICMDLCVVNSDGTNPTCIKQFVAEDDIDFVWSPDGGQIAFGFDSEIYVIDANGSNLARLTNNTSYDGSPDWSP